MFYVYTLLIPFLIAALLWVVFKPKKIIDFALLLLGILFVYAGIIYFLEMKRLITVGWVSYSLLFFLIPFSVVSIIIKLYSFFK